MLWPLDRPRVHVEGEAAAQEHLRVCSACRAFFERDAALTRVLQRADFETKAPLQLRERVFDALARERALWGADRGQGGRPRSFALAMGAALLVALLGAGVAWGVMTRDDASRAMIAFVDDYAGRAVEELSVEKPDPDSVGRFFMRELGVSIIPVTANGTTINRAMICLIQGERAAMVEYDVDGTTVAHYRVPRAGGKRVPERSLFPADLRSDAARGIQVVRWTDDDFEHALVSSLPEADLTSLASLRFAAR
jgi:anti-sigma factor RsiW